MFKILDEACTPTRGSKYSACVDLYAREDVIIAAGETVKVPLGICMDGEEIAKHELRRVDNLLPQEYVTRHIDLFMETHYVQLEPRSSIRAKGLQAGSGIVDIDYKGELMLILHSNIKEPYTIEKGDKVAQMMLCEHKSYLFEINTDKLRTGGFGSTGK